MSSHKTKRRRAAIRLTKKQHSATIAARYYLTFAKRKTPCAGCGGKLETGSELVYRHEPRELLCLPCAESRGIKARPSLKWEARRQQTRTSA